MQLRSNSLLPNSKTTSIQNISSAGDANVQTVNAQTANQGIVSVRNQTNTENVPSISPQKEIKGSGSSDDTGRDMKGRPMK